MQLFFQPDIKLYIFECLCIVKCWYSYFMLYSMKFQIIELVFMIFFVLFIPCLTY